MMSLDGEGLKVRPAGLAFSVFSLLVRSRSAVQQAARRREIRLRMGGGRR
ncbi:MAG: hypothetical protein K2P41_00830 [Lachnospiraceae bacterium]|nr:hypothetical protein [Lachnospiraceae bacterium]